MTTDVLQAEVTDVLARAGVEVIRVETRAYPEETNFLVYVQQRDLDRAVELGNELDAKMTELGIRGFVIVRPASGMETGVGRQRAVTGVHDPRASELLRLISARSRVSEIQPSLAYVRDAAANILAITAPRHHLVFGRRGAGKTALLVEAKRILTEASDAAAWVNIQTLRREEPRRIFLYVAEEICSVAIVKLERSYASAQATVMAVELRDEVQRQLRAADIDERAVDLLVPRLQRMLRRFLELYGKALYIFLDDFYYIPRTAQPEVLDMLHGSVRDCNAWLKIASIRHLTRWFQSAPPLGLQTGQDADILDLDVTLQDPMRAKRFLEDVLTEYARSVGITRLTSVIQTRALDRLVLASGAVPRDYLILGANAIRKAQSRQNARLVGVQDVNQAAGDAAQVKVQELEDDLASNLGSAQTTLAALQRIRAFCLEETGCTYYLVDFRDKERLPRAYNVMTELLDVRLLHLLDASVSDPHAAGQRAEAYMLDLSQFSGSRLKQGIRVLDFAGGKIVSRKTRGGSESVKSGDTARQVLSILRTAPKFELTRLEDLAQSS